MKLIERIKDYPKELIPAAVWCGITDVLSLNSQTNIIHKKLRIPAFYHYNKQLSEWIYQTYKKEVDYADNGSSGIFEENAPIWIMWLQGEEQAPALVKMCIESIRHNAGKHPIRIVSEKNISSYVEMPSWIWEKYRLGYMSRTNFADIVRFTLLAEYGGLWLDATVYVHKLIQEEVFELPFFSARRLPEDTFYRFPIPEWSSFMFSFWRDSSVIIAARNIMFEHWRRYNSFPSYFMIDFVFAALRDHSRRFRDCIDMIQPNNRKITQLMSIINEPYDSVNFEEYVNSENYFTKLSNRKKTIKYTKTGELTYYGELWRRTFNK